ncbi:hypothetical protein GCM10010977_20940 [Citricoccus zhacaiensis]|uniref:Fe/B12 periplasmic-binding domain-containing protein n=1 Tax=Citricoccus zhacaiensis TaxID=489142 RepID=A0ABQ2M331_9MICC|nr:ABC transporter substrate-binding protein [Citricoccus zhacaiensis]GGO46298.1 hypothetical protein GCM10010977_20940 [Citricoccus zhacaiensis]
MKRLPLALPLTLAAGALLLCAGTTEGADSTASADPAKGGAVTLTHPTLEGVEISFEQQPETLVMDCYAYSTLHEYGIEPDALFGFDCENPFVMGDIDISGIERIGVDGEIDVEKLAELRPDAVIGQGDADGWAWFDEDVNTQLTRVADFIPLPSAETVDEGITANREIAAFLGADPEAENITQADEDYADAKEAFSVAAGENDLDVMFTSPTKEMLYTGVGFPQANLLEELGATVVGPPAPETGNRWGQVAWEEASTFPADIILVEGYSDEYDFSAELWDSLPAVAADQLGNWGSKGAMTSRTYADWLDALAEQMSTSEKVS